MRGRAGQGLQNHLKYAFHILQDIIVPETQGPVAHQLELKRPAFVINHLIAMLSAVQLHDQASVRTGEIGDVRADLVLATEFPALQTSVAQVVPKQLFGIGLASAESTRPVYVQTLHP